jgi:hypothetical protein
MDLVERSKAMNKIQKSDSIKFNLQFGIRLTMKPKKTLLAVAAAVGLATGYVAPHSHRRAG